MEVILPRVSGDNEYGDLVLWAIMNSELVDEVRNGKATDDG
jgi:hypothetical protein